MARTAFIIGGGGQIGSAVAKMLLDDKWQVTIGSRGRRAMPAGLLDAGVRLATFDRAEPGALGRALGDGADLVVDVVAYDAAHVDQLAAVQSAVGSFVAISSVSVYRDAQGRTLDEADGDDRFPELPVPVTEAQPTVEPGAATYSTRKVALERRLLDAVSRPVTILRPAAIYGPDSEHPREWWFVKRLLDGRRRIPLALAGRSRFHTSAAVNIAALVLAVAERPATQILNAVDPAALTVTELGQAIMSALGARAEMVPVAYPSDPPDIGATPWSTYKPFVVSDAAARAAAYMPVVDYAAGVVESCRWLVSAADGKDWRTVFPVIAGYPDDPFDYAAEYAWFASQRAA